MDQRERLQKHGLRQEKLPLLFRGNPHVPAVAKRDYAITALGDQTLRKTVSIDQIQTILGATAQVEVDEYLIFDLGFDNMDWQLVDVPRSLYGLFLGRRDNGDEKTQIEEADGIIAVSTYLEENGIIFSSIDIAGNKTDNTGTSRAIALRYSLPNQLLDEIGVSVDDADISDEYLPWNVRIGDGGISEEDKSSAKFYGGTLHPFTSSAIMERTPGHSRLMRVEHLRTSQVEKLEDTGWGTRGTIYGYGDGVQTTVGVRRKNPQWDYTDTTYFIPVWEISSFSP